MTQICTNLLKSFETRSVLIYTNLFVIISVIRVKCSYIKMIFKTRIALIYTNLFVTICEISVEYKWHDNLRHLFALIRY